MLNPDNPSEVAAEVQALMEYAAGRGHDTQATAWLCALTMGCLVGQCSADDADARRAMAALVKVARHHAGIEMVH